MVKLFFIIENFYIFDYDTHTYYFEKYNLNQEDSYSSINLFDNSIGYIQILENKIFIHKINIYFNQMKEGTII